MSGAACSGNTLTRACPSFTRTVFQNVFHIYKMHHRLLAWLLAMASSMAYCLQSCYFVQYYTLSRTVPAWCGRVYSKHHSINLSAALVSAFTVVQRTHVNSHKRSLRTKFPLNAVCGARRALLYLCQRIFEDHEMHAALTHIAALALDGSSQHPTARLSSSIRKAASKYRLQTLKQ